MKKYVTFSAVLLIIAFAVIFVFAQTESGKTESKPTKTNSIYKVDIMFYYHSGSKPEYDFINKLGSELKRKYGGKISFGAADFDNLSTNSEIIKYHMAPGANHIVCALNNKYFLTSKAVISEQIEAYIEFILDPENNPNPMLKDLMATDTPEVATSDTDDEKLKCDTYLHDLLIEIDKIYTFDYIAEADVADVYVDVNFKKKLLKMSREDFEKALTTILDTYKFYFIKENGLYVIKQKPMIISETFELNSRIDFNDFVIQCNKLLKENETISVDSKSQIIFYNGSLETFEKISQFLAAIKKTYEYNGG